MIQRNNTIHSNINVNTELPTSNTLNDTNYGNSSVCMQFGSLREYAQSVLIK